MHPNTLFWMPCEKLMSRSTSFVDNTQKRSTHMRNNNQQSLEVRIRPNFDRNGTSVACTQFAIPFRSRCEVCCQCLLEVFTVIPVGTRFHQTRSPERGANKPQIETAFVLQKKKTSQHKPYTPTHHQKPKTEHDDERTQCKHKHDIHRRNKTHLISRIQTDIHVKNTLQKSIK